MKKPDRDHEWHMGPKMATGADCDLYGAWLIRNKNLDTRNLDRWLPEFEAEQRATAQVAGGRRRGRAVTDSASRRRRRGNRRRGRSDESEADNESGGSDESRGSWSIVRMLFGRRQRRRIG